MHVDVLSVHSFRSGTCVMPVSPTGIHCTSQCHLLLYVFAVEARRLLQVCMPAPWLLKRCLIRCHAPLGRGPSLVIWFFETQRSCCFVGICVLPLDCHIPLTSKAFCSVRSWCTEWCHQIAVTAGVCEACTCNAVAPSYHHAYHAFTPASILGLDQLFCSTRQ